MTLDKMTVDEMMINNANSHETTTDERPKTRREWQ